MVQVEELNNIIRQLDAMKGRFHASNMDGYFLDVEDQAAFGGMVTEAQTLINEALTAANDYVVPLIFTVNNGSGGFLGGPSLACVNDVEQLLRAAVRTIERRAMAQPVEFAKSAIRPPYVDPARMLELQRAQSQWDFSKLIQLCGELNIAHEHDCHHAVGMLVRSIMDHVPPVFGFRSFNEVASNHGGGGSSFKKSMDHLQKALRNIADSHLHSPIRQRESLPTKTQIDFRAALDQLLAETIRIA
ncbi:hypothetical protein BV326_04435 [Pseudomonas syringae pv. actinidiae]|uniref:hypothetical protein n=1 Tax=Pseudomonas syringae TaxID=317 RepID=UPI000A228556|nr:hypothetical protein [Pseudomonas syringae]OSR67156.1 hypothetical protein BV326_04435 [Pseudomonas syringae pv. actinidiae]